MASSTTCRKLGRGGNIRKSRTQPSDAFLLKCAKEREKLRRQLEADLRRSMQQLLSGGNFSDLTVVASAGFGNNKSSSEFNVHTALLKSRVPNFYHDCCSEGLDDKSCVNLSVEKKQLSNFFRKVYCEDDIRIEEITVVNAIGRSSVKNKPKTEVSPCGYSGDSSDPYLTPLSSVPNIPEAYHKEQVDFKMQSNGNVENKVCSFSNVNEQVSLNDSTANRDSSALQDNVPSSFVDVSDVLGSDCRTQASECLSQRETDEMLINLKNYQSKDKKLGTKERQDIKVINSLFANAPNSSCSDAATLIQSLTDSGFLSQSTSVHNDMQMSDSQKIFRNHEEISAKINTHSTASHSKPDMKTVLDSQSSPSPIYMFVDINDVTVAEENKSSNAKINPAAEKHKSVSMFVDLNSVEFENILAKVADDKLAQQRPAVDRPRPVSMFIEAGNKSGKCKVNDNTLKLSPTLSLCENDLSIANSKTGDHNQNLGTPNNNHQNGFSQNMIDNSQPVQRPNQYNVDDKLLLPMSPIMRRKSHKNESKKSVSSAFNVKASTRPQDVETFTMQRVSHLGLQENQSFHIELENSASDVNHKSVQGTCKTADESSLREIGTIEPSDSNRDYDITSLTDDHKGKANVSTNETPIVSKLIDVDEDDETSTISSPPDSLERQKSVRSRKVVQESSILNDTAANVNVKDGCGNLQLHYMAKMGDIRVKSNVLCESYHEEPQIPSDNEDDTETIYSEISNMSNFSGLSTSTVTLHSSKKGSTGGLSPEHDRRREYRVRGPCSKLGEDLLRMFLEEINTDVVLEVDGKEIKAHKCILCSRCPYFSALWKNKAGSQDATNRVSLHGYTYSGIHFALCHIYSGATNIPDDVDVPELALIADFLGLDGLKDVIIFHLKMAYCHFFHKPCNSCTVGIIECLLISDTHGLGELHNKAIKWIGRYYDKVWPVKSFSSLSDELIEKCYLSTVGNLATDNIVEMILSCDKMMSSLSHAKWAEQAFGLTTRLMQDCSKYLSDRFDAIITNDNFLALGKGLSWNVTTLEDIILVAADNMSPDVACRTYVILNRMLPAAESPEGSYTMEWTENFVDLLRKILRQCERYLIHNANHVVHSSSWPLLTVEMQQKIKDAAVIVFEFGKPTAPPPHLSSLNRTFSRRQKHGLIESSNITLEGKRRSNVTKQKIQHDEVNKSTVIKLNQKSDAGSTDLSGSCDLNIQDLSSTVNTADSSANKVEQILSEEVKSSSESHKSSSVGDKSDKKKQNVDATRKQTSKVSNKSTVGQSSPKITRTKIAVGTVCSISELKTKKTGSDAANLIGNNEEAEIDESERRGWKADGSAKLIIERNNMNSTNSAKMSKRKMKVGGADVETKAVDSNIEDESRNETEVSSVTSSEWDVNEGTSKSIKEAELLQDALTKKLESQNATDEVKTTQLSQIIETSVTTRDKTNPRKPTGRPRPVTLSTVPSVGDQSRTKPKTKVSCRNAVSSNPSCKIQTVRPISATFSKVTKDTNNQRRSNRATTPKSAK